MNKCEIIERLKNIAEHAVHTVGEAPFVMSLDDGIAVHEAIELLTNCPEIPDSWIPCSRKMPEEHKTEKCKWIRYDYRTICPKNHDIDNPYWRIPEKTECLKYCPYCGKEIEVEK